jgi:hypothetical protein
MATETNRTTTTRETPRKGSKLVHWLKGHDLWSWNYPGFPQSTECSCGMVWPR